MIIRDLNLGPCGGTKSSSHAPNAVSETPLSDGCKEEETRQRCSSAFTSYHTNMDVAAVFDHQAILLTNLT